jgi:hypothetical protein
MQNIIEKTTRKVLVEKYPYSFYVEIRKPTSCWNFYKVKVKEGEQKDIDNLYKRDKLAGVSIDYNFSEHCEYGFFTSLEEEGPFKGTLIPKNVTSKLR